MLLNVYQGGDSDEEGDDEEEALVAKHLDALILPDGTIKNEAVTALGLSLGEEEEGGGRGGRRRGGGGYEAHARRL